MTSRVSVFQSPPLATSSGTTARVADVFIVTLIVANVVAVILESVETFAAQWARTFHWFELFSVGVFSIEYVLRLWHCGTGRDAPRQALERRLRYFVSLHGIVDLLAILPFYLGMFVNADLRFLRVLRLMRILKLTRYSPALGLLLNAIQREKQAFIAAAYLLSVALVVAACGIYLCERQAQPQDFGSIPAAIWWAIATLTTVGYGDVTPVTTGGKVFGAAVMIVGVGMVALPTGILASTFADELRRRREDFTEVAGSALDDGLLTDDERSALEALRSRTGLSRDDAAAILSKVDRHRDDKLRICPHCGCDVL